MGKLSTEVTADDHMQGSPGAKCILVEYGDYQCPYCGAAYPVVKRLQEYFGQGLSFVFRNFPLAQIHPWAEPAAEVAEFAGAHGKFWEMHDLLFENQDDLGEGLFLKLARELDLSTSQLETALAGGKHRARVRSDFAGGARSGVNGTPTFFVNGWRHNGPLTLDSLRGAIEEASTAHG
jgi:protein-disulfide isomerase